jgi:hypothetical protein
MHVLSGVKIEFVHVKTVIAHAFTVCCLFDEETEVLVARGLAINSIKDCFSIDRSRTISFGRAKKACLLGSNLSPFRQLCEKDINRTVTRKYDFKCSDDAMEFTDKIENFLGGYPYEIKTISSNKKWISIVRFPYYYPLLLAMAKGYHHKGVYLPRVVVYKDIKVDCLTDLEFERLPKKYLEVNDTFFKR